MNTPSPRPNRAASAATQATTTLLDLAGELLAAIFARAQADTDLAYREAYGVVRAPNAPMPLVCRHTRRLFGAAASAAARRVMLVPLLRGDGVTPTFADGDQWAAYFRALAMRPTDDLRLVSPSPATPSFDMDASLGPPSPLFADAQLDMYTIDSATYRPHLRHLPCLWSFWQCCAAMAPSMLARVTALDLRLSMPVTLPREERDHRRRSHYFASLDLAKAVMALCRTAPRLQSVSVRVFGLFDDRLNDAAANDALIQFQRTHFLWGWQPFAHGLAQRTTTTPLQRLRVEVEAQTTTFPLDDFVLYFLVEACTPYSGHRIQLFSRRNARGHPAWHALQLIEVAASPTPPVLARQIQIAHAGRWDEIMAPRVLALLHAERFELLGAHAFRPRVDTVLDFGNEQALLDEAARERTAPLTLSCAASAAERRPDMPWLRIE